MLFNTNGRRKHIHIITRSQLNCPSFSQESAVCTKQDLGSMLPSDSHCPKLCRLSCTPITNSPSKVPIFSCFGICKTPAQKFEMFQRFTHAHNDSRLLFKKCSTSVQDKWPKVRVVLVTEKNKAHFAILKWNPWNDFLYFCVNAHLDPHLYSRFHPDPGLERYNRKTLPRPPE